MAIKRTNLGGGSRSAVPDASVTPKAGNYFFPISQHAATPTALGNNVLRLVPWVLTSSLTVVRIAAEVATAGEVGSKFRPGIYRDSDSYPGALLVDAGQINGDSTGIQELTINVALTPGVYWLGGATQSAATTAPAMRAVTNWTPGISVSLGAALPAANNSYFGYSAASVTGALPSTFPAIGSVALVGAAARILMRAA